MGRRKLSIQEYKQSLESRYGSSFLPDIERVKTFQFGTLSSVGEKYGVSREFIRQIFKRLFERSIKNCHKSKKEILKETDICLYDPRRKNADYSLNTCNVRKGATSELIVFKKLKELGFDDISFERSVDFKVNGKLVEIKSAFKTSSVGSRRSKYFRFCLSEIQRETADFIICYENVNKRFFVIPNMYFKNKQTIYIPEIINKSFKIQKDISAFENNFDALKKTSCN